MNNGVRLIDANSVCKKIVESIRYAEEWANEAREQQDTIGLQYASDTYSSLISMLERIQNEPTIEAEPVKHGRWKVCTQKDGTTIGQHNVTYCSECGYVLFTKEDSFCARCGARMDGDNNG